MPAPRRTRRRRRVGWRDAADPRTPSAGRPRHSLDERPARRRGPHARSPCELPPATAASRDCARLPRRLCARPPRRSERDHRVGAPRRGGPWSTLRGARGPAAPRGLPGNCAAVRVAFSVDRTPALPSSLRRQSLAPPPTAVLDDRAPTAGAHTGSEPVLARASTSVRLIGAFHREPSRAWGARDTDRWRHEEGSSEEHQTGSAAGAGACEVRR